MIALSFPATAEAEAPFVTRLRTGPVRNLPDTDSVLVDRSDDHAVYAGVGGLVSIVGASPGELDGDVVLVQPASGRAERLLRPRSPHNTLLVTERCDQLCVMCSQPPKKTHHDRFDFFEQACLLAEPGTLIGITGGEPTLYKERLLAMIERVLGKRPDLGFHVLSNGQHFANEDVERLRQPLYRNVAWGIPLYAVDPALHDRVVGKIGAFERLHESFAGLIRAGARVELRTVLLSENLSELPRLARYIGNRLRFVEAWSIMQLENIGYARNRWDRLRVRHGADFAQIGMALDLAVARGIAAQLFNFPLCTVPEAYRPFAVASISDWKKKFVPACGSCTARERCSGFFEWHPEAEAAAEARPL